MSEEKDDLHGCFGVVGVIFIILGISIVIAILSGLYKFVIWCFV